MAPERSPKPLVEAALELLTAKYVFPDRAKDAAAAIRERLAAGEYDGLDESSLAERLTGTLYDLCADRHLRVRVREEGMRDQLTDAELTAAYREQSRLGNYGIASVRRLDGNVGYLDLHGVADPVVAGRAIGAAMELVAHTHALIVDLRKNRGGTPDGVQLWHSHLFPDSDTHLNDIFHADTGETRQYWTLAHVPGPRYLDRPVYLLTSAFTFSAGEEFAYNLKALRRATLIGETTRGGAHPTDVFPITPTLEITVPVARSINPITGTNWEGTGVEPDVAVPADEAFDVAYRTALEHVLTVDTSPAVLAEARAALRC
jgi:C-terminal processing protease CtpA/Prc